MRSSDDSGNSLLIPQIAIDGHLSKACKRRAMAINRRNVRHHGDVTSQCCPKRIEEESGWAKDSSGLATVNLRERARVDAVFTIDFATFHPPKLSGMAA